MIRYCKKRGWYIMNRRIDELVVEALRTCLYPEIQHLTERKNLFRDDAKVLEEDLNFINGIDLHGKFRIKLIGLLESIIKENEPNERMPSSLREKDEEKLKALQQENEEIRKLIRIVSSYKFNAHHAGSTGVDK